MKKTKLTRSLMAACSIVALSAVMYGCAHSGGDDEADPPVTMDPPEPDTSLDDARQDAMAAATAADTAYMDAKAAAAKAAELLPGSQQAMDAAADAAAAKTSAILAGEASRRAQAATDSGVAESEQGMAEGHRDAAQTSQSDAEAERDDAQVVVDARGEAGTAAMAARTAAGDAQSHAATVARFAGDTSESAMKSAALASKADMAASDAEDASTEADAATTGAAAMAQRDIAVEKQGDAEGYEVDADELRREVQIAHDVDELDDEREAIADAQDAAGKAASAAQDSLGDAESDADAARAAATDARAAANRAAAARTDAPNAAAQATAAETAATAAKDAEGDAMTARNAANDANTAAMDAMTSDDAEMYQGQAETARGNAAMAAATAMTERGKAQTAKDNAEMYEGVHVVGLLRMANAYHITGPATDPANTEADELKAIADNKADHVDAVNMGVAAAVSTADNGGGAVTATYPYGDEGDGVPAISVTPEGGDAAALVHADADADPAVTANFVLGPGLGDFPHEKYITGRDNGDNTGTRVILFTDIEQASAPTEGSSDAVDNAAVSMAGRVNITGALVDASGENARNFPGMYDHDGDPATPAFTGTFTCADPLTCTVNLTNTNADGVYQDGTEVGSIANYRFTGTRTILPMNSVPDTTWLAFGVWLTETVVADDTNTYAFGAFAEGGDAVENDDNIETVTGTATYEGSAAGVHSSASEVEFFSAMATLKADFGNGTANGAITGEIHNIVSGGVPLGGGDQNKIFLFLSDQDADSPEANNIDADGSFDGRTRMGSGTLGDDGEYDYPYNGTWGGNFYNAVADDDTTTDVDESETAPGSVAGTFGVGRGDNDMTTMVDETESYVGAFGAHDPTQQ